MIPSEKFMVWNLDLKLKSLAYGLDHKPNPEAHLVAFYPINKPGRTLP